MKRYWVFCFLLISTLTACGAVDNGAANSGENNHMESNAETAVQPQQIICHFAYRANSGGRITQEESISIKNENTDLQQTIGEFDVNILYLDGSIGGERSLRLSVRPINGTNELTAQLYQLPQNSGPINQFIGGHGFTGLTYVTDPGSNAELQFWCTAE